MTGETVLLMPKEEKTQQEMAIKNAPGICLATVIGVRCAPQSIWHVDGFGPWLGSGRSFVHLVVSSFFVRPITRI